MNNFRAPIALFGASFIMLFVGLLFKYQNWPGAQLITGSMLMAQAISIVWLIVIIIKSKRK